MERRSPDSVGPETCRICLKGVEQHSDPLIFACNCKHNALVHKSCASHWLEITSQEKCPFCGFVFIIKIYPKNIFQYFKEVREELEEFREIGVRTVNILHLTFIAAVIWLYNPIGILQFKPIFCVTVTRIILILRLWYLYYVRNKYNFTDWRRTHFRTEVFPNPNRPQNPN